VSARAALALLLLVGPAAADPVFSHGWNFDEQGGEALFGNVCAACHQPNAKGASGAADYPALAGDGRLASSSYLLTIVLNGLNAMPPFGEMMTDAQVADVANYIRSHFDNHYPDTISAADVSAARQAPK
jgi:mono/diheme cytochrome c family protein